MYIIIIAEPVHPRTHPLNGMLHIDHYNPIFIPDTNLTHLITKDTVLQLCILSKTFSAIVWLKIGIAYIPSHIVNAPSITL